MNKRINITFSFCSYNRAERLDKLVCEMRSQICNFSFEILAVNNNSSDNTADELQRLAKQSGIPLRFVTESELGIVAARNRAIEEAIDSDILIFIDDDEIPLPGHVQAAVNAILNEGAKCVGGKVKVDFSNHHRPSWLEDNLLGFLAEVDYGNKAFWIKDETTPIWTANVAYDMSLFRNDALLRFDKRYDRKGKSIGGGEDLIMFRELLNRKVPIRYSPEMTVLHDIESWRINRWYFLRVHYQAGLRKALLELPQYKRTIFGVPPFLFGQLFKHCLKSLNKLLFEQSGIVRQAMNMTYTFGMIYGCFLSRNKNNE